MASQDKTYRIDVVESNTVATITKITCLRCGLTSYNPNDIAERFCGFCHVWHEQPETAQETAEESRARLERMRSTRGAG